MKSSNLSKSFINKMDRASWSKYLNQLASIELSVSEREDAYKAIEYLRKVLGEHFLADVSRSGHSLLNYFRNTAPVARIQITNFAHRLKSLEDCHNFHTLIDKIKKAKSFSEGETILEDAYRFQRAGFAVALDVEISFHDGAKDRKTKPDIKLTNLESNENLYVEVSEVEESKISIDFGRTYDIIYNLIHHIINTDPQLTDFANPEYILPYVYIYRELDDEETKTVINLIQEIVGEVRETGSFQEASITDIVDIGVSPYNDHSKAKAWASERNLSDFVEMAPIPLDDLNRVLRNLSRELKQLPLNQPGVVSLWNNHNLLFFTCGLSGIIDAIFNKIKEHPSLLAVILNYEYGTSKPGTEIFETENSLFCSSLSNDGIRKNTLLIKNSSFNLNLMKSTKEKFVHAIKTSVRI